ncbi:DUF6119 family protein [Candidatus Poriferisodalis sp.]|uniref:DUF6119 family protein n=1 Tax=Candidatus Poriferisodalis sp. TaxID=3101277 RepID=UPI003B02845A
MAASYRDLLQSADGGNPAMTKVKPCRINAADTLSVPLGKEPETIVKDLDTIANILGEPSKPELKALGQFVLVTAPDTIGALTSKLKAAINNPVKERIAVDWPRERIHDNGTPAAYKLTGFRRRMVRLYQQLCQSTPDAGRYAHVYRDRFPSVTLGMARSKFVSSAELYSFSQVTLTRLDVSLAEAGIRLTVVPIRRI